MSGVDYALAVRGTTDTATNIRIADVFDGRLARYGIREHVSDTAKPGHEDDGAGPASHRWPRLPARQTAAGRSGWASRADPMACTFSMRSARRSTSTPSCG